MNNNTNENGDFPRTGTPAHNKAKPRDIDSLSLADKYPIYEPDPACMECGGEGMIWSQVARHTVYGETELDYHNEPCECIFKDMTARPDKKCRSCGGTGEVEETHLVDGEKITTYYACVCLRYVPIEEPNNESGKNE